MVFYNVRVPWEASRQKINFFESSICKRNNLFVIKVFSFSILHIIFTKNLVYFIFTLFSNRKLLEFLFHFFNVWNLILNFFCYRKTCVDYRACSYIIKELEENARQRYRQGKWCYLSISSVCAAFVKIQLEKCDIFSNFFHRQVH